MKTYNNIGVQVAEVLVPKQGTDLTKWAVVAVDQYTSQPDYWKEVEKLVGNAPSTLHMVLPEIYLEGKEVDVRIKKINDTMNRYIKEGVLSPEQAIVYVERAARGKVRKGIMVALDLEKYDYNKGSTALIRATEGTILDRIPPRVRIRQDAPLESPHIMVLIDDPHKTVIEPLASGKQSYKKLYDFDLMMDSGHLTGFKVSEQDADKACKALEALADPKKFNEKYGLKDKPVLLFAMGDGNHSLATAKAVWEKLKPTVGMDHPARFALVELVNVHDLALEFEPIHRVLFSVKCDFLAELKKKFDVDYFACSKEEMLKKVGADKNTQRIGIVTAKGCGIISIKNPSSNLPVGTIQSFLDPFIKSGSAEKIDYVHGADTVCTLGAKQGNVGIYLPAMHKSDLFKTVILDGALPRKTFSMGEADEKRFYMECRKIR